MRVCLIKNSIREAGTISWSMLVRIEMSVVDSPMVMSNCCKSFHVEVIHPRVASPPSISKGSFSTDPDVPNSSFNGCIDVRNSSPVKEDDWQSSSIFLCALKVGGRINVGLLAPDTFWEHEQDLWGMSVQILSKKVLRSVLVLDSPHLI